MNKTIRRNTQGELIAMKKQVLDRLISRDLTRSQAAGFLSMHPNAVSRLKGKYSEHGIEALMPVKPGPKNVENIHNKTPEWIENMLCELAVKRSDLGPQPLSDEFFDRYGVKLNQTTVWRILSRKKIRYTVEYKRWQQEKPKLYCLDTPGLELQLDACYPFGRSRKIAGFDAIDDCSRWVYGKLYTREDASSAIDFIKHLIKAAPFRIQRIRVDNRYGKELKQYCESIGIEVIVNDPYTPKQNGKIERFHKTLKREFFWKYCSFHDSLELMQYKYNQWLNHYNTKRRHGGYGMNRMTPNQKIASTLFLSLNNINYPQNVTLTMQQYNYV
ncbi:MAG: DDE-type integrase/transposase/recombinase [Actinobacteria bacterium]|nr:DDE-type integrase/transposase/recombinase [Actinomycetota bacterium]